MPLRRGECRFGTSRETIEYIGLNKLEADPGNFYSLTGLEDLAANIELCGLQQPIRVRPTEDGRYVIVSGHRRWSALKLLRGTEGSGDRWASIPCIVERDEASQELRELRLILANSSTRVLSPAEVSKQAQRVETLLYQLKEQGYEFPGRMRDQVAAACKVSAPKLARLKVIPGASDPDLFGALRPKCALRTNCLRFGTDGDRTPGAAGEYAAEPAHREPGGGAAGDGSKRHRLAA